MGWGRALLLSLTVNAVAGRYRCKGIDGKQVDWFVVYKLPTGIANANGGKHFVYADSDNPAWQLSQKQIDDPNSAVGATVSQAYGSDTSSFVLMYSDDGPATSADSYRGHAKGVLVFDGSTGFWLVHSVPNFPGLNTYAYPKTGFKFAQSFLCVTLVTDNLSAIAEQLMYMQVTPFKSQLPERFAERFPILRTVLAKRSLPSSTTVFTSTKHIRTEAGALFHSYAKHKKYKKDLWHDLVASDMDVSLGVLTWLNGGAGDLHSSCRNDGVNVFDITQLSILGEKFSSSKDHSKWAVSDAARRPVVCVGDLNRQDSQLARGGGALCLEHEGLWRTYRGTVGDVEPCLASWARTDAAGDRTMKFIAYAVLVGAIVSI